MTINNLDTLQFNLTCVALNCVDSVSIKLLWLMIWMCSACQMTFCWPHAAHVLTRNFVVKFLWHFGVIKIIWHLFLILLTQALEANWRSLTLAAASEVGMFSNQFDVKHCAPTVFLHDTTLWFAKVWLVMVRWDANTDRQNQAANCLTLSCCLTLLFLHNASLWRFAVLRTPKIWAQFNVDLQWSVLAAFLEKCYNTLCFRWTWARLQQNWRLTLWALDDAQGVLNM